MSRGAKIFLVVIFVAFAILVALAVFISYKLSLVTPKVKSGSVLVINLQGEIPEISPVDPFSQFLMKGVISHDKIINSIKYAAADSRIKAAFINTNFPQIGWARAEEIAAALKEFKKSKKPLISYYELANNMDYYIASTADKVIAAPSGFLVLNGLYAELPFFKDLFDKVGIEAELEHIGDYKSASDIFTRKSASEAHLEMINWLLDNMQNNLLLQIKESRKTEENELKALINRGFFGAEEALKSKLIDEIGYRDEVIEKHLKSKKDDVIFLADYYKSIKNDLNGEGRKICLIYAVGTIESGKGQEGQSIGSDTMTEWIRDCYKDDSIKAIVMRVNSPGGSGIASDVIWKEVMNAKNKRIPFVVSMSDVAASGGYYISMAADAIFAEKTTLTGSIGVISGKFYINGLFQKLGVHYDIVKKADNADLFSSITHFTEEQRELIKEHMKSFYDLFISKAAKGRKLTTDYIDNVGRGRVWTGQQAKEHKLVDMIGTLDDAIEYTKKLAKIPKDEKVKLIIYPRKKNFFEALMELDAVGDLIRKSELKDYYYIKHLISIYSREPYLAVMPDIKISR